MAKPERRRIVPRWIVSLASGVGTIAVTLLGLLFVTFVIGRLMPIDPVLAVVGERASQSTYDQIHREMGLDQPIFVQFIYYLGDVLTGDFGTSTTTAHPVIQDIARVFPATLELATLGTLIGVLAGIPIMTTIGTILLVVGVVLLIAGRIGNGIGGRAHYF